MKKIIILYALTGGGHFRSAEAIAESIRKHNSNVEVKIIDGLATSTENLIKVNPAKMYLFLTTKFLRVYNFFYPFFANNNFGIPIFRFVLRINWGNHLRKLIDKENPDMIISIHHHMSPSTISRYVKKVPYILVVSDLETVPGIWFDKKADAVIVPTVRAKSRGIKNYHMDGAKIKPLGLPIKSAFLSKHSKQKFYNTVLVTGGGAGTGKIFKQTKEILKAFKNKKVVAICGINEGLVRKLKKIRNKRLTVRGFVDNLDEYMEKSDIIVTKPGPGTIIESVSIHKPLVVTKPVGRQEKDNVHFVLNYGLGLFCKNPKNLPLAIGKIYAEYEDYVKPQKGLEIFGTEKIAKYILSLLPEKSA